MLATIVAIIFVDVWGRKVLFLQGGIQMLLAEVTMGIVLGIFFADPSRPMTAAVQPPSPSHSSVALLFGLLRPSSFVPPPLPSSFAPTLCTLSLPSSPSKVYIHGGVTSACKQINT